MHYFLVFLLLLSVTACHKHGPPPEDEWIYAHRVRWDKPTDDLTYAIEQYVTGLKYDKRLHLENALICEDEGGPMLRLEFKSQAILEMCEARQLLVYTVEGLLDKLNTNFIEPELRPYPFTVDNLEIYIDFESFYGVYDDPYYIGWIALEENMAYYEAFTLKLRALGYWNVRTEPYFKSRSIAFAEQAAEGEYMRSHLQKAPADMKVEDYTGNMKW